MTVTYLDASAAMKLVLDEPESAALVNALTGEKSRQLVSSWLLHTEMCCAAGRHPDDVSIEPVLTALETVNLVDLTRGDMIAAGTHAPLRAGDAVHLAVAIRLGVDEVFTYDRELATAVQDAGLKPMAPA